MNLKKLTETEFMSQVIQYAKLRGWKVAHFRSVRVLRKDGSTRWKTPVQADGAGWPDLILCRPTQCRTLKIIAAELKVPPNKTSAAQLGWLETLNGCGVDSFIWTPADWPVIERVLA